MINVFFFFFLNGWVGVLGGSGNVSTFKETLERRGEGKVPKQRRVVSRDLKSCMSPLENTALGLEPPSVCAHFFCVLYLYVLKCL